MALNPVGIIRTLIFEAGGLSAQGIEVVFEYGRQTYPVGRLGEVQDTISAIAFLANDAASFVTGHLMLVDGGKPLLN